MLLAVDVGNTQIKLAVFEQNTLLQKEIVAYSDWKNQIENTLKKFSKIDYLVVASVGKLTKEDFLELPKWVKIVFISHQDRFPFQNLYSTPQTLGLDRMVLAAGAVLQFPKQNRLVIDAGTCITYDFVDEQNNYWGGAISPGIRLRYEALHNYTAKLPLVSLKEPAQIIGDSTEASIHSGVVNGVSLEIDGFVNRYYAKYENFIIILTGGDAEFLAKRLKNTIFANPNFLLESLNQTFQYNQK